MPGELGRSLYDDKHAGYFANQRREMMLFVPGVVKRLLDVGCGAGEFGHLVKESHCCEAWGIEPDPTAAELARLRLDRVVTEAVEKALAQLPDRYFDCIFFNDVLEHLVDPWGVLNDTKAKLTVNGRVVASIPNIRFYPVLRELTIDAEWRYLDEGVLDRTHLRFFTQAGIRRLFETNGYTVEKLAGINAVALPKSIRWLNWFARGRWDDVRYCQFAVVARVC